MLAGQCCWHSSGEFYRSSDYGQTWVLATEGMWNTVMVSDSGRMQLAVPYLDVPLWSEDYGNSWTKLLYFQKNQSNIRMSANGEYVCNVVFASRLCIPAPTS